MKNLATGCLLCLLTCRCTAQTAAGTWSVKFSDAIISRWPTTINSMTGKGWEYSNTIITHGMEKVYNNVPTPAYLTYIKNYVDTYVNSSGGITATFSSLDRIHPGISVLFLYEKLKSNTADSTKYRTAATTLRNVLVDASATYTKTANGIFWHKLSGYNNIVMLDGIYMAHPFLVKYGSLFGDNAAIDTAVNQTLFVYSQLYDNTTHLIKHAWTSTPASYPAWANASTGNSSEVWSRAMGWYMMALVDILKYLPASHPKRANLLAALSNLAIGIKNYQDATTGLWYQVVDKGIGHTGYTSANYVETSGSAMFVYALKTGVDSGWLSSATYLPVAQTGWTGLKSIEITTYSGDSKPQINNFAPAMSYQNDYNGYVSITSVDCPTTVNPHGYAAILMAASAMEFPLIALPVKFTAFSAKEYRDNIQLSWQNADDSQVDYYSIQKSDNGIGFSTIAKAPSNKSGNYNWVDNSIGISPVNYYRIQAISLDGTVINTNILSVKTKALKQELIISPNPAKGRVFSIGVNNLVTGVYSLKIISNSGQTIDAKSITVGNELTLYQTINLLPTVPHGVYFVQFEGGGISLHKSILID
jgi:unsaturated rhamnogalacturonyl hydrolase